MKELRELQTPERLQCGKHVTIKKAVFDEDGILCIPEKSKEKTGVLHETIMLNKAITFSVPRGDNKESPYGQIVSSKVEKILQIMGSTVIQTQKSIYVIM